jgi:hypothetical protein
MPVKKRTGRKSIYDKKYLRLARDLGKQGFSIVEAAEKMGLNYATMLAWERKKPEFRLAFRNIRENSERWKALRFERMLKRTEEQLLAALARVREKKASEMEKYKARFG